MKRLYSCKAILCAAFAIFAQALPSDAKPQIECAPMQNPMVEMSDQELHSMMQRLFDKSMTKELEAKILVYAETGKECWGKHTLMGAYYEYYGLVEQADEEYEAAYSLETENPEPLFALIRWKIQNKKLDRAEQLARTATQKYPNLPHGWRLLAVLSLRRADNDQARRCMSKIMQLSLSTADDCTKKILELITQRDFAKALSLAKDYSLKNPDSQVAQMLLATVLMQSGQKDEAVDHLRNAFKKAPLKSHLLNQLYAQLLMQKNRLSEAIEPLLAIAAMEAMRQPHQLLPAQTSKFLGEVFAQLPESTIDDAATFIAENIKGNGMRASFHFMVGDLFVKSNKGLCALRHYRRGVEFVPDDSQAHLRLAQYLEMKVNHLDEALVEYQKVASLIPAQQAKGVRARIANIQLHKINDIAGRWRKGLRQFLGLTVS